MKGELEEAVNQLPYQQISILRPPSLIRKNTTKTSEKIAVSVFKYLNRFGIFMSQRPMKTELVAHCMIELAKSKQSGVFEAKDMFSMDK